MKILGAIMVFTFFSGAGFSLGLKMRRRSEFWNAFICALEVLKAEISFSGTELRTALKRTADISGLAVFSTAAEELSVRGLDAAWYKAVNKHVADEGDKRILLRFSSVLGKTDVEGQVKHIEYMTALGKEAKTQAEEEYLGKGRLCCRGGILVGLLGVLILL